MKYTYRPQGTCSQAIELDIEGNTLNEVFFWGGCSGNLQGISRLVKGRPIDEVIGKLEGIRCGYKSTSCPDQLTQALRAYKAEKLQK
ncbi:MAG: TIGR03905 family TSCPD domain-containing protein [Bacteroidales bacterium]|nr:TIGR03905 family TSCPD domain-containing protein [Bacteroidales bacterium]